MDSEKIGQFIKTLREEKNITQQILADKIHISRQAISKWELGKAVPDHIMLLKLSEIFDVSIDELLAGEKNTNKNISLLLYKQKNCILKKTRFLILIMCIMVFVFLTYYFFNQYNSTKIYTISTKNDTINIENGLLIQTKEKIYFNLGTINSQQEIEKIDLVYKNELKENLIYSSDSTSILLKDYYGYEEYFTFEKMDDIKKNLYIIVFCDDKEYEIKLILEEDYKNNNFFFRKKDNIIETDNNIINITNNDNLKKILDEKFKNQNDKFLKVLNESNYEYSFNYMKSTSILLIEVKINNEHIEDYIYDMNTSIITYISYAGEYTICYSLLDETIRCIQGICQEKKDIISEFENIINKIL